jgi:hypothetical protein
MKPFAIVIHFDIFEYLVLGLGSVIKSFAMHRFDLEAVVSAFHGGIGTLAVYCERMPFEAW